MSFHFHIALLASLLVFPAFAATNDCAQTGNPDLCRWIENGRPSYPGYRRMKAALQRYLSLASEGDGAPLVVPEEPVNPGDHYSSLPQLAERLRHLGDLSQATAIPSAKDIYDGAIVEAVKHFQLRHGLPADGALDSETFKALVTPLRHRAFQLRLALEQWRWLASNLPPRFIVVNLPQFQLQAFDNGHPSLTMRVIVGEAPSDEQSDDHHTPLFHGRLEYLLFNPYWNVPAKIMWQEIIPAVQADQQYLTNHDYEFINRQGLVVAPDFLRPDVLRKMLHGELRVRQKPGPENSMGTLKFVFPNPYGIYLHGTPEQELFSYSRRDFSHGCIRVEDPAVLAEWILREDPSWTRDRVENLIKENFAELETAGVRREHALQTLKVTLRRPIPIFIVYQTAVVDEVDEVHFFEDIYHLDSKSERTLVSGYKSHR